MASHKQAKLYTLCVGTNVTDPVEARLDGDMITYQLPYDLPFISVLGLIHGELGTDEKLSRLFYLDDESEYVQINTQDEYNIALSICKQSRHRLHVVVSGKDIQKKKLSDIEAVSVPNFRMTEPQNKPQVEEEFEIEAQSSMSSPEPTMLEMDEVIVDSVDVPPAIKEVKDEPEEEVVSAVEEAEEEQEKSSVMENMEPVEVNETIKKIIKQEVEVAVESKMRDILAKMPTVIVSEDNKQQEDEGSMELIHSEDVPTVNNDLTLVAILVCENLLNVTSKPNIKLQKYWVFRNDGTTAWNQRTKLILEHETYDLNGTLYFKREGHEWGANIKQVQLPTVKQGETGVVEVVHVTPPFKCQYESCWRLEHNGTEFGKKVRCCITVTDGTGTPVDNNSIQIMSTENNVKQSSIVKQKNSFEQQNARSDQESPPTDDNISNMLSFNMTDISRVSGFLPPPEEPEAGSFDVPKGSIQSLSSYKSSNVDGISQDQEIEKESLKVNTSEQQHEETPVEETSKEEEDIVTVEEEVKNEEDVLEESEEHPAAANDSDDLHSVDYDEHAGDNDFHSNDVSDFVVVLPECFNMNQPLSQEQPDEATTEEASSPEEGSKEIESPQPEESIPKQQEEEAPAVDQKIEEVVPTSVGPAVVVSSPNDVPSIEKESQSAVAQELPTPLPRSRQNVLDTEDIFPSMRPEQGSVAVSVPQISVPRSVLDQDQAYPLPVQHTVSVPFEQGWRQVPIALPSGVTEEADDDESTGVKEVEPVAMEVQDVPIENDVDEEHADSGEFETPPLSIEPTEVVQPPHIEPSPLDQMYDMGFHNIDLNEEMLVRCEGDISRAVQALLMRSLADNSILPLD